MFCCSSTKIVNLTCNKIRKYGRFFFSRRIFLYRHRRGRKLDFIMGDAALGAFVIVVSVISYTYYSVWILMTPWLETSSDLASWLEYFPDRYYALALPALLLVLVLTAAVTFIGSVLSGAGVPTNYRRSPSGNTGKTASRRMHLSPRQGRRSGERKDIRNGSGALQSYIFDSINGVRRGVNGMRRGMDGTGARRRAAPRGNS